MVLIFHMQQILILVRTVLLKFIYLLNTWLERYQLPNMVIFFALKVCGSTVVAIVRVDGYLQISLLLDSYLFIILCLLIIITHLSIS